MGEFNVVGFVGFFSEVQRLDFLDRPIGGWDWELGMASSTRMAHAAKKVVPYTPPTWAAGLLAPPGRLHLIPPRYATPIQDLTLSHPLGSKSIAVKRDDMTGASGDAEA